MATPDLSLYDFSDVGQVQKGFGKASASLLTTGGKTADEGMATLTPLLTRLRSIVSGNASEIEAEAEPEISGTRSSYQAARDAITNFTPRGGGLTTSMAANRTAEASDIAKVRSSVRSGAQQQLGTMGAGLLQSGLGAQEAGVGDIGNVLSAAMKQQSDNRSFWSGIGSSIAKAFLGGGGSGSGISIPGMGNKGNQNSGNQGTDPNADPFGGDTGDPSSRPIYGPWEPSDSNYNPSGMSGSTDPNAGDSGSMGNYGDGEG